MSDITPVTEPTSIPLPRGITLLRYDPNVSYYGQTTQTNEFSKGVVFFAPAMATKQTFYRYYLDFLSDQGYLVYSFDYSGVGLSLTGSLKGSDITMHTWIDDLQDAVDWVLEQHDEETFYYICHSLGGQFFGFLNNQNRFQKFVGITSQNGYWRLYRKTTRYFFIWYLIVPLATRLRGYFPGQVLGFGVNLPSKVMLRWKRWCTSRNYFFDDNEFQPDYSQYQQTMLTIGFEDDDWATQEAIDDLYEHYTQSEREHWHLAPADYGLDEIGHFGYFRSKSKDLWEQTLQWLQS